MKISFQLYVQQGSAQWYQGVQQTLTPSHHISKRARKLLHISSLEAHSDLRAILTLDYRDRQSHRLLTVVQLGQNTLRGYTGDWVTLDGGKG